MDSVVAMVSGLAPMSANRSTCNSNRLAPQSLCVVLEPEITALAGKAASKVTAEIRALIRHMSRTNPVGSAAYSWGTA